MAVDSPLSVAERLLRSSIEARLFPAAAVEVGSSAGPLWQQALGTLTFDAGSEPASLETIFDLASLTKPLATTCVALDLITSGRWALDDRVAAHAAEWRGADRASASLADLLEHSAGLSARLIDVPPTTPREFEHEISTMPLDYAPRSRSVYSDLGFILLGFCAARTAGSALPTLAMDVLNRLRASVDPAHGAWFGAHVPPPLKARTAPTMPLAEDRRGRLLVGEVHDSYAALLGGFAGHAGLFGTAAGVGVLARVWLRAARGDRALPDPLAPHMVARALRKSRVPGSSRALGWDTMLPTSSCGTRLSSTAFGHVGFTGTSLWIDPIRDRYFVLLTNRACGGGSPDDMQRVRRAFHDTVADS
ncbi:MAG: serine hydrolase domain-containing protein [Vicinamibacterales bacterium]